MALLGTRLLHAEVEAGGRLVIFAPEQCTGAHRDRNLGRVAYW